MSIGKIYTFPVESISIQGIFRDKNILIAGGTGGIGAALTKKLLASGGNITVIGRKNPYGGQDGTLREGNINFLSLDLDSRECLPSLKTAAEKTDVLCIVRGPFLQKTLHETSAEEWESTVFSNLTIPGAAVSSALPGMKAKNWGRILLFGGTRTDRVRGFSTNAAYAAAKTGISSLIRSVAENYADYGISCCGICPGFTDTEYITDGQRKTLSEKIPGGKLISPEKIADMAVFLLSHFELNGSIITPDCAWTPCKIKIF